MKDKFIVKHYGDTPHPTIKGNGFDGLVVGDYRDEAENFIGFINKIIDKANTRHESSPAQELDTVKFIDARKIVREFYLDMVAAANKCFGVDSLEYKQMSSCMFVNVNRADDKLDGMRNELCKPQLPTPPKSNAQLAVEAVDGTESEVDIIPSLPPEKGEAIKRTECCHCGACAGDVHGCKNRTVQPQPPEGA